VDNCWLFGSDFGRLKVGSGFHPQEAAMTEPILSAEQEQLAKQLAESILEKAKEEALRIARLLVSKTDHELLGATEFEVRDRVHAIGAHALQTALEERKKGGTKGRARPVPVAGTPPGSSNTDGKGS
jgi:hypothetical protein